jgi:hypothetical protein
MLPSRALPGHQIWHVDRVSDAIPGAHAAALLTAAAAEARRRMRVLRVDASVVARGAAFRAELARAAAEAGYRRTVAQRSYAYTLVFETGRRGSDARRACRGRRGRNVRAVERQPVAVRPIADPTLAPRMDALMRGTLARTGGAHAPFDWAGAMRVSAAVPERSRLVGMFRADTDGPDALLAFSWGLFHGDHAVYDAGASTRATGRAHRDGVPAALGSGDVGAALGRDLV